jgi:hypothetical protein
MITVFILVIIAAVLNAVMDILENENFHSSRFVKWNEDFWYKRESWKHARKIFGWKFDGWHVAKSLMLFALLGAISNSWIQWLTLGAVWNTVFGLTYKFLKKDI